LARQLRTGRNDNDWPVRAHRQLRRQMARVSARGMTARSQNGAYDVRLVDRGCELLERIAAQAPEGDVRGLGTRASAPVAVLGYMHRFHVRVEGRRQLLRGC
jgi:hypothetical protein